MSATQGLTIAVVYGLLAFVAALPGAVVLATRAVLTARASAEARRIAAAGQVAPQPVTESPITESPVTEPAAGSAEPLIIPAQRTRVLAHSGA
jgi:hypothetical protein